MVGGPNEGKPVEPLEADRRTFEKLQLPKNIVVTSGSAIKINAVQKALNMFFVHNTFMVTGVKVDSGVNEQPVGGETETGARTRVANARGLQSAEEQNGSAVLSIENGIFSVGDGWEDRAVAVLTLPGGKTFSFTSSGVSLPNDAVDEARKKEGGFVHHTVGSVIAEKYGGDKQDPHTTLTNGAFTREQQLIEAIRGVFLEAARG